MTSGVTQLRIGQTLAAGAEADPPELEDELEEVVLVDPPAVLEAPAHVGTVMVSTSVETCSAEG
ncbi:MAG: hypothetical protein Q8Q65_00100 [bacterium]|nr:hypothetical protein [bacterium]